MNTWLWRDLGIFQAEKREGQCRQPDQHGRMDGDKAKKNGQPGAATDVPPWGHLTDISLPPVGEVKSLCCNVDK